MNGYSEWIPLVSGFDNAGLLDNIFLSVGFGIVSIVAILVAVYFIITRTNTIPIVTTFIIFLALLLPNLNSLRFSSIYPAVLCIVWMQFCFFNIQVFTGFLLLSLGSLFYAPLIWLFPFALFGVINGSVDTPLRTAVKAIGGFMVPHIYLLVFRWIAYDDATVYLQHFVNEITEIGMPFHLLHITDYFLLCVLAYMFIRAIILFYSNTPDGFPSYILKAEFATLILLLALVICFCNRAETHLLNLCVFPISIILAYYYKNCKKRGRVKTEFAFLAISILICCISKML